jgi:isopenicillin-N epimerase
VQALVEPLVVSWGWESDDPGASRFIDHHQWQGTRDVAAYLAVPAAIAFMEEHGWHRVRCACRERLAAAGRAISELTGLVPITPDAPEWFAQMAALPLPPCDATSLQRQLYTRFRIEVPIIDWNGHQFVRVSVQGYNNWADLGALVDALRALLPGAA